jgi:protein-S-isoprenylcysteine O-methyltransferase Ste14
MRLASVGYLLRHLLSVLALPTVVAVVVPGWIAQRDAQQLALPTTVAEVALAFAGVITFALGLGLFAASLHHFFVHGRGTLAPWDPPRRLVIRGPYRYVRNPMISGVIFMLVGTALALRSWPHARWAGLFILINCTYIPLLEEPQLAARFGADYARYRRHVRRFVPRVRPWIAEEVRDDS